jgi:hypothetical protein
MTRRPWTASSRNRQIGERRATVALVLAFLTVSWLPLSVRAWSAAWSGLHPASAGQLVRLTTPPAMRPEATFSVTPSKWAD